MMIHNILLTNMILKMLPLNRQVGRWEGARREQLTVI